MPTTDLTESFSLALRRLGTLYARVAAEQSAEHGAYSKQDLLALDAIGLDGPMRMGDLADALGVGQSAATPVADRLEGHGWVRRVRSQADRRVWLVELTDEGRRAFEAEDAVRKTAVDAMLAPLDDGERAALVALLEKITRGHSVPG
ncbi:MarR family winged helix-turn-helix transcriptional regulator [Rubrivirga sp. IMCC45206]|uniref:MarR family winged helix-turn-helix transcriptional regulator n=1 Tax=Rubrivirga sp. IMCC45206 TaxID=3391614 RepID=UPI00398FACE9